MRLAFIILFYLLIGFQLNLHGQSLNNWHSISAVIGKDTLVLDSLSIVPNSINIFDMAGNLIPKKNYREFPGSAKIIHTKEFTRHHLNDSVNIQYRTFPIALEKQTFHKDLRVLEPSEKGMINPFMYTHNPTKNSPYLSSGLSKTGSISRGLAIGNNQDLSVSSNLDLQISGKLNERVNILAAITDRNIPIQPDGTTAQIQEFDQAYVQLYDAKSKLTVGDFRIDERSDYFLRFLKKARGGLFETSSNLTKGSNNNSDQTLNNRVAGAISKGKFSRYQTQGQEGIQGPYKLSGANNELFIVVLSGTERVFIDGELMKRGQDHDYTINYNTAEITFTAKRMITKDKRIVVEFQYSDRNYVRSMYNTSTEFETEKFKIGLKYYSEQDNRNQSLQQDLTDEQKLILFNAGDSLQNAIINTELAVPFSNDEVLYRMMDSLGHKDIFVYTTNEDSISYRVKFSNVGQGFGNYIQANTSANGKVFKWLEPISGIPQGNYAPKSILAAPSKKQLIVLNNEIKITKNTTAILNLARSENDINLFSEHDKKNDVGYAFRAKIVNDIKLFNDTTGNPWRLISHVSFEGLKEDYSSIERFRSVEFTRDWNLQKNSFTEKQYLTEVGFNLLKKKTGNIQYNFNSFNEAGKYSIFKNEVKSNLNKNGFKAKVKASYLETKSVRSNSFARIKGDFSKATKLFTIGVKEEFEQNLFKQKGSDSLVSGDSYQFLALEGYLSNSDSATNKYRLNYKHRLDKGIVGNSLSNVTLGESVGLTTNIRKNKNSIIKSTTEYRRLRIMDSTANFYGHQADKNLVNRLEYLLKLFKGTISTRSFYEIGSGLEVKKEFQYLEVPIGQGAYVWKDHDNDGIQELNEFEVAQIMNEANFIKVFTPTSQYVKTSNNQFNQSLYIKPAIIWKNKKGIKKVLSKLSTQTTFRIDRKTKNELTLNAFNPFYNKTDSLNLITENYSLRNILFLNKGHSKIGGDIHTLETRNKMILVNGFDERRDKLMGANFRWNINKKISLTNLYDRGEKNNSSEAFSSRNYQIEYEKVKTKLSLQPNSTYRVSALFNYQNKKNLINNQETALIQEYGAELKFNSVTKGSLMAEIKFIRIDYDPKSDDPNTSSISYEMLEGLQNGNNITWRISFQKKLANNMQLSINYDGRYSETANVVHTGGAQIRAFF
ncbi:MAG: hypothetical protein HRT72_12565 [Flavobacteriales bacterium]|nr:hypothetical protein [Flavobacteriales bacterium]